MKPILHTINDACEALGIGRTALYEAINAGELVARKRGSRTLIHDNDLNQFAESLPKKPPAE
jgi:excisionase family DNA binding protein